MLETRYKSLIQIHTTMSHQAHEFSRHRSRDRRAVIIDTLEPVMITDYSGNGLYLGKYVPHVYIQHPDLRIQTIPFCRLFLFEKLANKPDFSVVFENWEKTRERQKPQS